MKFEEIAGQIELNSKQFAQITTHVADKGKDATSEDFYMVAKVTSELGELFAELSEEFAKAGLVKKFTER